MSFRRRNTHKPLQTQTHHFIALSASGGWSSAACWWWGCCLGGAARGSSRSRQGAAGEGAAAAEAFVEAPLENQGASSQIQRPSRQEGEGMMAAAAVAAAAVLEAGHLEEIVQILHQLMVLEV